MMAGDIPSGRSRLNATVGSVLAAVFLLQAAAIPVFADGAVPDFRSALPPSAPAPQSPAFFAPLPSGAVTSGPTETDLRRAFPARTYRRVEPGAFASFARAHAGQGLLLTGAGLSAVAAAGGFAATGTAETGLPRLPDNRSATTARERCDSLPDSLRAPCRDSLARSADSAAARGRADAAGPRALRERGAQRSAGRDSAGRNGKDTPADTASLAAGEGARDSRGDADAAWYAPEEDAEARGWFAAFIHDLRDGDAKGGGWDADDWAAVIYVVVGVVVVGAFLIYGVQTLVELAVNGGDYPVFQEAGLRLSYSGHAWRDGAGTDLYRDAYLAGLRYGIGFVKPGMDLGLAAEGGYLDIRLRPEDGPGRAFDFKGGYLVAGPLLRFGSFDPFCFSLEFLNGTATHASIGWISKARMALHARIGRHLTAGAHLGAVFYDLEFLDGLAWRRGNLNRDLSLVGGFDFGWVTGPSGTISGP